jgi:putative sigma-54 modulation protein
MQINISGHHVDVTPALRDYVTSKLERLNRHFEQITIANVVLTVEKSRQRADATLHVSGADLAGSSESEDMYAAIDLLTDKLDRQLIKHKEKIKDKKQGLVGR